MENKKKLSWLSYLIMGSGQILKGEHIKGIILLLIEIVTIVLGVPYFANGLWGLYTLGETKFHYNSKGIAVYDHSIFLMLQGIISIFLIAIFIGVYIYSIKDARKPKKEKKESFKEVIDRNFHYIVMTPGMLSLMFFILLPIIFTVLIAFTDYSSPYHLPPRNLINWVGLQNFKELFGLKIWNETLSGIFIWTVVWGILATVTSYFVGLLWALIINSAGVKIKKLWRTIFIIPYAVPGLISMLVMRLLFNGSGPINDLFESIGLPRIGWLTDPTMAKATLVMINMWLGAPYFMALMTSILTNIPKDLYESSDIDGATAWQKFRHITLPMVLFSTMPLLISSFAYNFNNFMLIYSVSDGGPVNASYRYAGDTDILISWIYKMTLNQQQYHMASVVTIFIFVFIAPIVAYSFTRSKSFREEDLV
ncbi:carbohydrate ABC transporter permease [Clostridium prolinivorans]|uniref:carbohydrate ABC transporter permease n=1 Tax=Clostridium prolinivorans TaxID=2769420 RepID=UPI000FDBCF4C|nr:sugar ABC transporter permease [Clostridium prolinivorans]